MRTSSSSLLLVEDNPGDDLEVRTLLIEAFPRPDDPSWEVTVVRTLAAARKQLETEGSPTVILSDIGLPDSDGTDTVTALRAAAQTVPLVILTGHDNENTASATLAAGAQDYLVKGQITPVLLRRTILYALERHELSSCLLHANHELAKSEKRFRLAFEESAIGMLLLDTQGICLKTNEAFAQLVGRRIEDIKGGPVTGFIANQDQDEFRTAVQHREHLSSKEIAFHSVNGQKLTVLVSMNDMETSAPNGALIVQILDITARKQADRALHATNARLEHFVAIASHDLKAPLRRIKVLGDMLATDPDITPDEQGEILFRIRNSTDRMSRLVDDSLNYARTTPQRCQHAPIDLALIFAEVLEDLTTITLEENALVRLTPDSGPLPILWGAETQIRQLLQNLIANGVKFHRPEEPPIVTLHCTTAQNECVLTIADNGIGIPQDQIEEIFEPFRRLHTADQYEGSGLGLATCKNIIDTHNGNITVASYPGKGTSFTLTLPLHAPTNLTEHDTSQNSLCKFLS